MIERIAVIGAGNGGKASAVEFTLHGKHVRLFEFPEFRANIEGLIENPILTATGAVNGEARLDMVTTDLSKAVSDVDTIMVCTQALVHERIAKELAPLVQPHQLVILNPGSTGGSLLLAKVFREIRVKEIACYCRDSHSNLWVPSEGVHGRNCCQSQSRGLWNLTCIGYGWDLR